MSLGRPRHGSMGLGPGQNFHLNFVVSGFTMYFDIVSPSQMIPLVKNDDGLPSP